MLRLSILLSHRQSCKNPVYKAKAMIETRCLYGRSNGACVILKEILGTAHSRSNPEAERVLSKWQQWFHASRPAMSQSCHCHRNLNNVVRTILYASACSLIILWAMNGTTSVRYVASLDTSISSLASIIPSNNIHV